MSKVRKGSDPDKFTDEQLLAMFSEGDVKAYNTLVERYKDKLFSYLVKNGCRDEDAEDILQDAFFTLYSYQNKATDIKFFSQWIYKMIIHDSARKAKLSSRFESLGEESIDEEYLFKYHKDEYAEDPDDFDAAGFNVSALENALSKLEPHYREVVLLRLKYMEYEEIAEVLQVPVGTVKSRINMAKARLKKILSEEKEL